MDSSDWVCHRPNRSHSVLEFDLMRDALVHPILPPSLVPPQEVRRDEEGRIWHLGGPTPRGVYDALANDYASVIECSEARRQSFRVVRRCHEHLYRSLVDPKSVSVDLIAEHVRVGMRALYASLMYGLLDDVAFDVLEDVLLRYCSQIEVETHLESLMSSTTASAAVALGIAFAVSFEFDARNSHDEAISLLRPLDVEVPGFEQTAARTGSTVSGWPECDARSNLTRDWVLPALFGQLYEFGQENFFVGARFRRLASHVLLERSGRSDYLSMSWSELVGVMR